MKNNYSILSLGLLSIPFFILFISSILFICGFSLNPYISPVSIILSSLFVFFGFKIKKNNFILTLKMVIVLLVIVFVSLLLSFFSWDYSYDGQSYHQAIILVLKEGWNPVYQHHSGFQNNGLSLWIDHYAKGIEIIAAAIYSATGYMECGKAVNFIIIIASFFFVFNLLDEYFSFFKFRKKVIISFLLAASPVVVNQFITYYIDWSLYSLLVILICAILLKSRDYIKYVSIVMVVFLSTVIKFNILFFVGFTIFIYLFYLFVLKEYLEVKKIFLISVLSLIGAIFISGINPYITNTIDHHNPFYPIVGSDSVDILTYQTPTNMRDKSRFEAILISLFSETNAQKTDAKVVFPLYLSSSGIKNAGQPDIRVGGFGVFFSGILILSLVLYLFSQVKERSKKMNINLILFFLFFSIFILPAGWWARYVPFFYSIPIVILLYSEISEQQGKGFRYLRNVIYFLLLINIGISFLSVVAMSIVTKAKTEYCINLVKASSPVDINFDNNIAFKVKLDDGGIIYNEANKEDLNFETLGPVIYLKRDQLNFKKVEKNWVLKILKK